MTWGFHLHEDCNILHLSRTSTRCSCGSSTDKHHRFADCSSVIKTLNLTVRSRTGNPGLILASAYLVEILHVSMKKRPPDVVGDLLSGRYWTRTNDLCDVNATL